MLDVTTIVSDALDSYHVRPLTLVSIEWSAGEGGTVYITDASHDIVHDGNTYDAAGGLLQVSPPRSEGIVDRDLFNVTLADPTFEYRNRLLSEAIGVNVEVQVGFVDTDGTQLSDTLNVYKGRISGVNHSVEQDQPRSTIECSGPLTKLTQTTNRSTTDDSQRSLFPNDSCFSRSFDSSNQATLLWGGLGGQS